VYAQTLLKPLIIAEVHRRRSRKRARVLSAFRLFAERTWHFAGGRHRGVRVPRCGFLLCNGAAACFVRCVSIAKVREWLLALPAGCILWWWRARVLRRMPLTLLAFLLGRFTIADARPARHRTLLLSSDQATARTRRPFCQQRNVEPELSRHRIGSFFGTGQQVQKQSAELRVDEHLRDRAIPLAEATASTAVNENDHPLRIVGNGEIAVERNTSRFDTNRLRGWNWRGDLHDPASVVMKSMQARCR
jgi:hypothetical protein